NYGYLIPYHSFSTAKVLAQLLHKNIKVRYAEKAFTTGGRNYDKGTLIVLKTSNAANWAAETKAICEAAGVEAVAVSTGYSEKGADFGSPLDKIINHAPKVALLTGEGVSALAAGEVWNYFEQQLNYPITQLTYSMMGRIDLNKYDVVIAPEGQYRDLNSKPMADKFQAFVRKGGVLIALESAAQQFASNPDWGIKLKEMPTPSKPSVNDLPKYGERVEDQLTYSNPGAIYKVKIDDTHPIGYGTNGIYYDLKQDAKLYEPSNDIWNVGAIKKDSYVTGFVGVKAKSVIQDGVVIGVKEMGAGKLVFMADDPIFRNFWESGKLILANAVFLNGK
ncbi:MAG: zinc carboxypeptidase, partial [Sediminibacterium sp.]